MSATQEQLLSLEDVANRLQVSDQSVRRWIKAGKLAAYKPGLEWRIRPSDLEEFLQARSYPKVQASLPDPGQARRDPTEADIRAVKAIQDRCNRLEEYLANTAGKSDPDDMDKLLLTTVLGMAGLMGEIAPAVMEKDSAHALLRPVADRFLKLGKDLVAMAEAWELPSSETAEAHSNVTDLQHWLERAS